MVNLSLLLLLSVKSQIRIEFYLQHVSMQGIVSFF